MENVVDDREFRKELLYYKFPACGEDLYQEQLKRTFYVLYRPDKERKRLIGENESIALYNNKAMLYDDGERYKYIMNGGKLFSDDTLKNIVDISKETFVSIIHHNDMDGDAAAALVNIFASNPYFNNIIYHTSYSYTIDSITPVCNTAGAKRISGKFCIAFVVDISLTEDQYRMLLSNFDEVIWIDHHMASLTMLDDKKFDLGKSQIILDTRYSATYLCYYLLKDYIKQHCNLVMNDTLPTLISIEDTRPDEKNDDKYVPVILTEALRRRIKDKYISYKISAVTDLIRPSDPYYESTLNSSKTIYIKNAIGGSNENGNVKFIKCKYYGMYLNSYYRNMGGMNSYSNIYETLLTNDKELFKVLDIGKGLKELDNNRKKLISESETIYLAKCNGRCIIGNQNNQLPNPDGINDDIAKIIVRRISSTKFKLTVMSQNKSVKAIGINKILKDLFGEMAQGGHKGISSLVIPVRDINNFFENLKNGYSYKYKNIAEIKQIYESMQVDIRGSELRKDEVTKRAFMMISSVLFSVFFKRTQKHVESMINA